MRSLAFIHSRIPTLALTAFLVSSGCGSVDPLAVKDREINELRFENERRRDSLLENLEENVHQRQTVVDLSEEKKTLFGKTQDLATSLRTATEQLTAASAQRDEARVKLTEVEQSNERLRESLEKVKSVASASVGELAELRLRRRELEEQSTKLTQSEASLREENGKLSKDLADARAELIRARAVARSFQESGAASAQIPVGGDGDRNLEREIAGLRGENLALLNRIEVLSAAGGAAAATATPSASARTRASSPSPGAVYREDPAGLLAEIGGFAKRRYDNAVLGKIAWDSFDLSVVGVAALLILMFTWGCVRRARVRRLLEEALRGAAKARQSGRAAQAAAASQANESHPEAARTRRPSSAIRRSSFPGVISAKDVHAEEDAVAEEAEAAPAAAARPAPATKSRQAASPPPAGPATGGAEEDPFHRILAESAAKAAPAPARAAQQKDRVGSDTRKVIGARSWEAESASADEPEDNLACTQIIPSIEEEAVVAHAAPSKAAPAKKSASSSATAKPSSKAVAADPADKSDDRELLAELKSVINRKFDELMK